MSPPKAQGDAAPSLSCSDLKLLKLRSERTLIAGHWLDLVVLGTFGSLGTRGEESIQECHFCHIRNKNEQTVMTQRNLPDLETPWVLWALQPVCRGLHLSRWAGWFWILLAMIQHRPDEHQENQWDHATTAGVPTAGPCRR